MDFVMALSPCRRVKKDRGPQVPECTRRSHSGFLRGLPRGRPVGTYVFLSDASFRGRPRPFFFWTGGAAAPFKSTLLDTCPFAPGTCAPLRAVALLDDMPAAMRTALEATTEPAARIALVLGAPEFQLS